MELQFPSLQTLFLFSIFIYIISKLLSKKSTKKLPPGPWKLPLIGNMHQLVGALPHHTLKNLAKKHGPLMHLQLGETSSVVVSSPEMAKEVLIKNGNVFAHRPNLLVLSTMTYNSKDLALAPYGSYWRQLRKICTTELLNAETVMSFQSIREDLVSNHVREIASNEGSPVNLSKKVHDLTCSIIARAAFGQKCKDQDAFLQFLKEFMKLSGGLSLADMYPSVKVIEVVSGLKRRAEILFRKSDKIVQSIVDEHRERIKKREEEEKDDLVDILLKIQENGGLEFPLTDIDVKGVILDIFSGGTQPTSTILNWAIAEIMKNPRVLEKAQKEVRMVYDSKGNVDETSIHELKYLAAIIKETFRLHPPLPLSFPRQSEEPCEVKGYEIPAKTQVIVNTWALGRDPEYWTEAETFLPERFLDCSTDFRGAYLELIPFGAGRRICPGIPFALPSIELPLAQLLYHFDWKLPNGKSSEDLDMTEEFGLTVTTKQDLVLVPTMYHNSVFK